MENYIEEKKKLYSVIYGFLENSDEKSDNELGKERCFQGIEGDREEMLQFLEIIKSFGNNHHRDQNFNQKMKQILLHFKDQIKQTFSNDEIFQIFECNKKLVLFLLKNDIIQMTYFIYTNMMNKIEPNGIHYWHFFIPEIENLIGEEKMKFFKEELLINKPNFFDNYEEKRLEGENDSYICSLIRQDSVVEFIAYINRQNISPSSQIISSIFETNPFLNENKKTTLIEYSAFFGSINIFQYLVMNEVELTSSLWIYAIHSNNSELIAFLESKKIPPPENIKEKKDDDDDYNDYDYDDYEDEDENEDVEMNKYIQCFIESIKCHHNEIANYIEINLFEQNNESAEEKKEIISNCIKYHNYSYFCIDTIIEYGFFYLSFYHYDKLVKLLFKKKEKAIEEQMI